MHREYNSPVSGPLRYISEKEWSIGKNTYFSALFHDFCNKKGKRGTRLREYLRVKQYYLNPAIGKFGVCAYLPEMRGSMAPTYLLLQSIDNEADSVKFLLHLDLEGKPHFWTDSR